MPATFADQYVVSIFFPNAARPDLGSKPVENLKESAILLGTRVADTDIVQVHPEMTDGFLFGFPKTSTRGVKQLELSARVGRLALKAKFNAGEMLYHGQRAL